MDLKERLTTILPTQNSLTSRTGPHSRSSMVWTPRNSAHARASSKEMIIILPKPIIDLTQDRLTQASLPTTPDKKPVLCETARPSNPAFKRNSMTALDQYAPAAKEPHRISIFSLMTPKIKTYNALKRKKYVKSMKNPHCNLRSTNPILNPRRRPLSSAYGQVTLEEYFQPKVRKKTVKLRDSLPRRREVPSKYQFFNSQIIGVPLDPALNKVM